LLLLLLLVLLLLLLLLLSLLLLIVLLLLSRPVLGVTHQSRLMLRKSRIHGHTARRGWVLVRSNTHL